MTILNRYYQGTRPDRVEGVKVEGDKVQIYGSTRRINVITREEGKRRLYYIVHDAQTGNIISEHSWKELERLDGVIDYVYSALCCMGIPIIKRLTQSGKSRMRDTEIYYANSAHAQREDLAYWRAKADKIPVYQGSIDEVAAELGAKVQRVDTRSPIKHIQAEDNFELRVNSYLEGANAVVHYQPGSSIGTPVKVTKRRRGK